MQTVITGDYSQPEFLPAFESANCGLSKGQGPWARFVAWHELESIDSSPDFLFVAQNRRGQWDQNDIDQLLLRFPLTQKAIVTGSWCEGETRSGHPLRGMKRVSAKEFPASFSRWRIQFQQGQTTELSFPPTWTRTDQLLNADPPTTLAPLRLGVQASSPEFFSTLSEFGCQRNWQVIKFDSDCSADLLIFECYYSVSEYQKFCQTSHSKLPPAVVVCGFHREIDRQLVRDIHPENQIIPKPFCNEVLAHAVLTIAQNSSFGIVVDVA